MNSITEFENIIKQYYGSPYAVAVDCCTHAIELCLRYTNSNNVLIPKRTYVSVPMTCEKLNLKWGWNDVNWQEYYLIENTNIIDAAVYWKRDGHKKGYFNCLSFQYKKHLNLGRGGMILTDDKEAANVLKKMSYDGRSGDAPWSDQDIDVLGYHYYMTPETAKLGLDRFQAASNIVSKSWSWKNYPDLSKMKVFDHV